MSKLENTISNKVKWINQFQDIMMDINGEQTEKLIVVIDGSGRLKFDFNLNEANANLELLIIFLGRENQNVNLLTEAHHNVANTRANVLIKTLLFNQSKFDVKGNLIVPEIAQGTDTYLRCDALLMSKESSVRFIPALEVIANEVKAGHSASSGQLDEEKIFYLASRGFKYQEAVEMLIQAFIAESKNFFTGIDADERDQIEINLIKLIK